MKIFTSHGVGGGPSQCHQMTQGGGGPKLGQKSVTYHLNGPKVMTRRYNNVQIELKTFTKEWRKMKPLDLA